VYRWDEEYARDLRAQVGHFLMEAIERGEAWPVHYTRRVVCDNAEPPNYSHVDCSPIEFSESLLTPDHISTLHEVPLLVRYAGVNVVMLEERTWGHWAPTRYAHRRPDELEIAAKMPTKQYPVLSPNHATVVLQVHYRDWTTAFQQPSVGVVQSFHQTVKGTKLRSNAKLFESFGEVQRREMEVEVEVVRGHGIDESKLPENASDVLPANHHQFPNPDTAPYMVVSTYNTIPDGNCLYR
jgi:hypothetical protein